ncbi:isoprenylcysteine carboxylmethyltransferase family protein [Candidatus Uhrbacteria bacterium]|nr:isoprenylcysteine carboxylmethyltransferase family protein [Candidatus Uhrbacteria bacterium]
MQQSHLKGQKSTVLLTTGPFKYTRHPMYTGLFFMDLGFWLPHPVSSDQLFFVLQLFFMIYLTIAAYFQEKETLARFGEEARVYYAKTPRLFFFYPFMGKKF